MRISGSKVKVQTDKLLEAVKARRAVMVADHERALAKYERENEAYGGKVCAALGKALERAEAGKFPAHETGYRRSSHLEVPARFNAPDKPSIYTDDIDRLIATLEMAADPTMTISAEDAARYLG